MSAKASLLLPGVGWAGYLGGLIQIYATAGVVGSGIVVGWCFGREYADRTVVSLYASATPRTCVAWAKLVLLAAWSVAVGIGVAAAAGLIGIASGLGLPDAADGQVLGRVAALAVLSGLLALPVALPASIGRGYLPAVGGLMVLVVAAQVAMVAGAGTWWPWTVAAVWAMGTDAGMEPVAPVWLTGGAVGRRAGRVRHGGMVAARRGGLTGQWDTRCAFSAVTHIIGHLGHAVHRAVIHPRTHSKRGRVRAFRFRRILKSQVAGSG